MSGAEARTWGFALFFSLAFHGALLWQVHTTAPADAGHGKPTPTVTRVRFNTRNAKPRPVQELAKPAPEKRPPKPVAEKAPVASVPVPVEETSTAEAEDESVQVAEMPLSGSETSTASVPGAASLAEVRQSYQSELLAHIERNKFYPPAARRRGVVGGVRVAFIVEPGGKVASLECGSGPAILNGAACETVRRAVPLPQPPAELMLPLSISFVMEFALK